MSLTSDTMQFIAHLLAITVALGVLGIVGIDGAAVFVFGDGEALKLIGMLNGPLITAFGTLGGVTVGHQVLASIISRLFGSNVSAASPGASINVPMSVPVQMPTLQPQPAPTPVVAPVVVANGSGV